MGCALTTLTLAHLHLPGGAGPCTRHYVTSFPSYGTLGEAAVLVGRLEDKCRFAYGCGDENTSSDKNHECNRQVLCEVRTCKLLELKIRIRIRVGIKIKHCYGFRVG